MGFLFTDKAAILSFFQDVHDRYIAPEDHPVAVHYHTFVHAIDVTQVRHFLKTLILQYSYLNIIGL